MKKVFTTFTVVLLLFTANSCTKTCCTVIDGNGTEGYKNCFDKKNEAHTWAKNVEYSSNGANTAVCDH